MQYSQASARSSLQDLLEVRLHDGSSLSLDQQLRWTGEPPLFLTLHDVPYDGLYVHDDHYSLPVAPSLVQTTQVHDEFHHHPRLHPLRRYGSLCGLELVARTLWQNNHRNVEHPRTWTHRAQLFDIQ